MHLWLWLAFCIVMPDVEGLFFESQITNIDHRSNELWSISAKGVASQLFIAMHIFRGNISICDRKEKTGIIR